MQHRPPLPMWGGRVPATPLGVAYTAPTENQENTNRKPAPRVDLRIKTSTSLAACLGIGCVNWQVIV